MRWAPLVLFMGCGGATLPNAPMPGSSCVAMSKAECVTSATAAFCESGKWVEYRCPTKCTDAAGLCDWNLSAPGDACPVSLENAGFCASATSMMTCKSGKYAVMQCATACTKHTDVGTYYSCN